jgi:hypothetical protein
MADKPETEAPETPAAKRPKKLTKDLASKPGVVVITVQGGAKGAMAFAFKSLPDKIQVLLGPFGLGHKLGDAAAGRAGKDAEEAISKVWEGLKKSDWSVRAPAAPKISVTEVAANFNKLNPKEQATAKALLDSLGIKLPGME